MRFLMTCSQWGARPGAAVWPVVALVLGGCNAVLGINEPKDWDGGTMASPRPDAMNSSDATARRETSTSVDGGGGGATHPFADWPMPNPASAGLPNPQSYDSVRANGVVLDRVTGLEWQQAVDKSMLAWSEAGAYCAELALDGGGFRLPSRIELLSIVDYTQSGSGPVVDPEAFPDTPSEPFWTASPIVGDGSMAWSVHFGFETIFASATDMANALRIRCVRQARPGADRYAAGDATVQDTRTKLIWQQAVPTTLVGWTAARDYCTSLDLNGTGWRLPSVNELQTLVDETKSDPAIDRTAFPNTPSDHFWTSSRLPRFESFAWTVYFGSGMSTFLDIGQMRLVRCVR